MPAELNGLKNGRVGRVCGRFGEQGRVGESAVGIDNAIDQAIGAISHAQRSFRFKSKVADIEVKFTQRNQAAFQIQAVGIARAPASGSAGAQKVQVKFAVTVDVCKIQVVSVRSAVPVGFHFNNRPRKVGDVHAVKVGRNCNRGSRVKASFFVHVDNIGQSKTVGW